MKYIEDFIKQISRYYVNIQEIFSYAPKRKSTIKQFRIDIINQIIGKNKNQFASFIFHTPNKFYKHAEKVFDKWENDLNDFQYEMEDAWERVLTGSKEDMLSNNGDDDTDPDEIDDYEVFNNFDKSYFVRYAIEEIRHNVIGRYPIWDKYIEKNFDYSKLHDVSRTEDIWMPVEDAIDNLQQELESLKTWFLPRIRLIYKDININKRGYIILIFEEPADDWPYYSWEESEGVWNDYD